MQTNDKRLSDIAYLKKRHHWVDLATLGFDDGFLLNCSKQEFILAQAVLELKEELNNRSTYD